MNIYGSKKDSRLVLSINGVDNTRRDIGTEKTWEKAINFLSKYAQRANPTRDKDKDKGRLK